MLGHRSGDYMNCSTVTADLSSQTVSLSRAARGLLFDESLDILSLRGINLALKGRG